MRRMLTLTLVLSLCGIPVQAQTARGHKGGTPARSNTGINRRSAAPDRSPVFLSRQGAASIGEMMNEPPTFSYGSSINIWLVTDKEDAVREVALTGHGDTVTCRRVSGKVMGMFLDKQREPDDLFVAGAAHMTDRGNAARRRKLEQVDSVKAYLRAERELQAARVALLLVETTPGTGAEGKSALEEARATVAKAQASVDSLSESPDVREYIREGQSADALDFFASDIQKFSRDNGLVTVRHIPLSLIEAARARLTAAAGSRQATVVAFDDLLAAAKVGEAVLITPVLNVSDGRPFELRVPLAQMTVSTFEEAQRNNRDEVEKAIIGDARQRINVYRDEKKLTLSKQAECKGFSPERMNDIIELARITTEAGIIIITKTPQRMTRRQFCEVQLPLNLRIYDGWIKHTEGLLATVSKDANLGNDSRLRDFTYTTLIDSMLRNWRLPVARSQTAFDTWRKTIRGPVWATLAAQLERNGIAPDVIGGEQIIFSVEQDGADLIIRPQHVIDMSRAVVLVDPAAKVTRVLDAWSLRFNDPPTQLADDDDSAEPDVPTLIRGLAAEVEEGNDEDARARLVTAFSRDPEAAFKELEREWLSFFPDTQARLSEMRQSLQPQVEASEWMEALERFQDNPSYKEDDWDYLNAFQKLLDSHPKAPVDLHLRLALQLAAKIAESQDAIDRSRAPLANLSAETNPWSVVEAFSQPLPSARPVRGASRNRGPRVRSNVAALRSWRQRQDRYLGGRKTVTQGLFTDPAPMILKAVQVVKQREPEYWAAAQKVSGLPSERSLEWRRADEAAQKQLTLFEARAQSLIRFNDWLRKSYWGSQSARYLWSTPRPDMPALLSIINVAVGDGSTGSDSAYLGPRETVSLFVNQRRTMDTLTRYQNASALQSGSEGLLAIARGQLDEDPPKGFRESLPLTARFWYESGDYLKAFTSLFTGTTPIALYHPDIRWQSLPGDVARKPLSVSGRLEGGRLIFSAVFEGDKKTDVLAIDGLSEDDAEALYNSLGSATEVSWSDYGKVSDQILLTSVPLRPAALAFRDFLLAPDIRLRVMKSMIYGSNAPGTEFLLTRQATTAFERRRASVDEVKGDRGGPLRVPTLAEVKRLAAVRVGRGN